jgi:hypothetical protein
VVMSTGIDLTTGSSTTRDLDLEIHKTQGGGLKDMSRLCLTRSQRHSNGPRSMREGFRDRETAIIWLTIDIFESSLHQSHSPPANSQPQYRLHFRYDASNTYQANRQSRSSTIPLILTTKQRLRLQRRWPGKERESG